MSTRTHGIVVGYDASPDADVAARWAAEIARLRGEPVQAVVVVEPVDSSRSQDSPAWWEKIEDDARRTLVAAGATDVTVEHHVGALVTTLLDAASEASMLVLGSSGHSRIGEIVLGSVSQSTARRAHCPVVVIRAAHAGHSGRIVVGADGSEPSQRALDFACRQAAFTSQNVAVVRAWRGPHTIPVDKHGDIPASMSATLLEEEEALDKTVAEARTRFPDVEIEGELIAIGAGQALEDASNSADLVVVGSRGHGALAETVLGSVSHHVLHRAHCPVAVLH
jgi:nucleotide-binding universal stress UspA family protein